MAKKLGIAVKIEGKDMSYKVVKPEMSDVELIGILEIIKSETINNMKVKRNRK